MSYKLDLCKLWCYINVQCMKHVIYAVDICLLATSAIGQRQILEVCFNFSPINDIIFNVVKSVAFQPKKSIVFCSHVKLNYNVLKYIS